MHRTLRLTALLAAGVVAAAVPSVAGAQPAAEDQVRVVHLVVDSLHPSQVGPLTPVLAELKAGGTWYEQARAVMAAETLPNHVAMGTGTYPERNGIPGNNGRVSPGDEVPADPDLGQPALLRADSVTRTIETVCPDLATLTVFSKEYVHRVFEDDGADRDFPQEQFNIPGSGHAPDVATVGFLLDALRAEAPDYVFANLGDVDRAGHVDATGVTGVPSEQLAAIEQTDRLVGTIVETLRAEGLWDSTVLIVNSDHSMDWSVVGDPASTIDVGAALDADPRTAGRAFVSENGGAGLVYLRDPTAADAGQTLVAARSVVTALDGVDEALYREPNPLDPGADLAAVHPAWRLGTDRAGELFVTARAGFRIGSPQSNPIPGTHGHAITRHSTMLVTGGWDGLAAPGIIDADPALVDATRLDDTEALPGQAENVDVAPTVGWLLDVPDPAIARGEPDPQWQGRVLEEAFARRPAPACVDAAAAPAPPAPPTPPVDDAPSLPATGGGIAAGALVLAAAVGLRRRASRAT